MGSVARVASPPLLPSLPSVQISFAYFCPGQRPPVRGLYRAKRREEFQQKAAKVTKWETANPAEVAPVPRFLTPRRFWLGPCALGNAIGQFMLRLD
jgi:hypothetical protein